MTFSSSSDSGENSRGLQTVGVLGGMGPYATAAFYKKLLELTPAKKDWNHLRVILDVNPHIASRSRHFLYDEPSPVEGMIDSCRKLAAYPVDFITIPCNSACFYHEHIQPHVPVEIVNIIEVAIAALERQYPDAKRVAVFGGVVTWGGRSYEPFLERRGMTYVSHTEPIQRRIEGMIEALKLCASAAEVADKLTAVIEHVRRENAPDAIILGCSEFLCLGETIFNIPIIDSNVALARATLQRAGVVLGNDAS